jgi:AraC-like DNA-binding protein
MAYSSGYFSKYFHKRVGISFQDYVIEKRIELAKELLQRNQEMKISSVAFRCGYNDVSYFSRIFKKRTGKTPQQYKADKKNRLS